MNTKVLVFQNKKLAERLEILKLDEERLRERLEDVKKKRNSDFEILSIINRAWTQLDEDVSILQQSYVDGVVEGEFGDQSDTALSYLEYLSQVEPALIKQEVGKRVANSKQCIQKLLSYMEKARCFPPRPIRIVASKSMQTVTDEEASAEQMDTDEVKENVTGEDKGLCQAFILLYLHYSMYNVCEPCTLKVEYFWPFCTLISLNWHSKHLHLHLPNDM